MNVLEKRSQLVQPAAEPPKRDQTSTSEEVEYPSAYTVDELVRSLQSDGFTIASRFLPTIQEQGLVDELTIVTDGANGMRVGLYQGKFIILTYNGLSAGREGTDSKAPLANTKYYYREIKP